jgi:hypothetical protein
VARKLIVEVVLDAAAYSRQIKQAQQQTAGLTKGIEQTGRATGTATVAFRGLGRSIATGVFGGITAARVFDDLKRGLEASVVAASDLNEQTTKTRRVFDQASQGVIEWSKTTTQAFGISERDALKTASTFGALFSTVGIGGKQAADLSENLTQLGADLASFSNTPLPQALQAIQSGLVGQVRPLREYGVRLSAARVQQEALRDSGKKHASQLTEEEKLLARIKIIYQDTQKPQGDFQRTQEGLANQTRILTANIDDLATKIGEKLIPAVTTATTKLNDFMDAAGGKPSTTKMKNFTDGLHDIRVGIKTLGEETQKRTGSIISFGDLLKGLADAQLPVALFQGITALGKLFPTPPTPPTAAAKKAIQAMQPGAALNALTEGLRTPKPGPGDLTTAGGIVIGAGGPSIAQQNRMFDALIGRLQLRAGLTTNLDKQIAIYRTIVSKLQARINVTGDITRKLNLEDQVLQVNAQIAADVAQKRQQAMDNLLGGADVAMLQAQLTKRLSDDLAALELQRQLIVKAIQKYGDTKELQLKLIQNQLDVQGVHEQAAQAAQQAADQARQEKVGWMEFAFERAQATKTVADDLKTANVLLRYWQKQASTGKRTLEEAQQVFRWQQEIANLRKKSDDQFAKFRPVDASKFVAGLGLNLSLAQTRNLIGAVAGIGRGGTLPPSRTAAFAGAGGMTVHIGTFNSSAQNPEQLEDALTKRAKARPQPRRGAR